MKVALFCLGVIVAVAAWMLPPAAPVGARDWNCTAYEHRYFLGIPALGQDTCRQWTRRDER